MADKRNRGLLIALLLIIPVLIALLLTRCVWKAKPPITPAAPAPTTTSTGTPAPAPATPESAEVLTPATLTGPERVTAGATLAVAWTGPNNPGDYVTIVAKDAEAAVSGNYQLAQQGPSLDLTAPMEPGAYEIRYVTARSKTVLGRAAIEVVPAGATLDAAPEVVLGTEFPVSWTGPNNTGDYVTVVPRDAADEQYGNYVNTQKGSPLTLTAPPAAGDAEVRYVAGQGRKVLARRPIRIIAAAVTLTAPEQAVAGTTLDVTWTGPNNSGDYITIVAADTPDGQYGNYLNTSGGSPVKLLLPIMDGPAELRYMTGQGAQVLARRPIKIVAAAVSLSAPAECAPGADVSITWTGPSNPGDYITIVKKGTPENQYGAYTNTTAGSPLTVAAPKEPGEAEIRYCTGQGNKVLARIAIRVAL